MTYAEKLRHLGDKYEIFDSRGCEECGARAPLSQDYDPRPADDVQHEPHCLVGQIMAGLEELDELDALAGLAADDAERRRCTCRYVGLGGNDPDGHVRRDRDCPLHGADPDYALEAKRDEAMERAR